MFEVDSLFFYPVKGLGAIPVKSLRLTESGPEDDRRWMVIDENGRFLSQRSLPEMTLISVQRSKYGLTLDGPDMPSLTVSIPTENAYPVEVQIWEDSLKAQFASKEASEWLSGFLGTSCRLVYMSDETTRTADRDYTGAETFVRFVDAFPGLLTTTASLHDLNRRMAEPVSMSRFRPNLVVGGGKTPFEEDDWDRIEIGDVVIRCVKPCARCSVTTVDPSSAETGTEPLRTLATFRKHNGQVFFGQNFVVERPGTVRVGDAVIPEGIYRSTRSWASQDRGSASRAGRSR